MKNRPLTKSDLTWVLIRVFGVFFAYQAISAIVLVFNGVAVISNLPIPGAGLHATPKIAGIFWKGNLAPIFLHAILAFYFLKHGKFVYDLVMWTKPKKLLRRTDPTATKNSPEVPDRQTTLTPTEELEFTEWLETNPRNSDEELDDQIAKFRDFQRSKN